MATKQKDLANMVKGKMPIPKKEEETQPAPETTSETEAKKDNKEPEKQADKPETAQETEPDVRGAFEKLSNGPSKEQVEKWKIEYGNVFASGFSEEEIILWRPLMRQEYRNLKTIMAQAPEQPTQEDQEEAVVDVCVLWPTPDNPEYEKTFRKAGIFSTLHEQILQASCFVHPGVAGRLVVEL